MHTRLTVFFILLAAGLITACAPSNPPAVSKTRLWLGANKQTLLDEWGKPANIKTLPDGSTLYQYTRSKPRAMPYPTPQQGVMVIGHGQTIGYNVPSGSQQPYSAYCYTDFEITPDNKIKSVQQRGEGCY